LFWVKKHPTPPSSFFLFFSMFPGIVVKFLFQKSRVLDETFHLVRPFCLTMKISLILEDLKFWWKKNENQVLLKRGSKLEKPCFLKESWLECFARVVRLKNSVSKLAFSCRLLRSCRLFSRFSFFSLTFWSLKTFQPWSPQQWIFYYVVITIIIMITKMGSKIEKVCFPQELLIKCFTKVFHLENSVSKLTFSCRLLRSCKSFFRFSVFFCRLFGSWKLSNPCTQNQ